MTHSSYSLFRLPVPTSRKPLIKQCVMSGMGVAVLPAIDVAREVQSGGIAVLSWAGPELQVVTQLVRHKDKWLSPALQAFLMITQEVLVGSQVKS